MDGPVEPNRLGSAAMFGAYYATDVSDFPPYRSAHSRVFSKKGNYFTNGTGNFGTKQGGICAYPNEGGENKSWYYVGSFLVVQHINRIISIKKF